MMNNPIICAIDFSPLDDSLRMIKLVADRVAMVKLGLEFFSANGAYGVKMVTELGIPVFLDLKLHDIPNTVIGALRVIIGMGIKMVTVHISGGIDMLDAIVNDSEIAKSKVIILGVTVLTSMNEKGMKDLGITCSISEQVVHMAKIAKNCGLHGIVCSPREISLIRKECGNDFLIVTPGIRLVDYVVDDQKRTATPKEAMNYGANYIVIGRPITTSPDPVKTIQMMLAELY